MSTTVDQRVVEMQFDNRQFEKNVSTTMSTLDKLKQSLKLTEASKGLEEVGTAAKGIRLEGLSNAAHQVGLKFNAMYTMADQALRNITNSAMAAGKRIVSALTIDPIKTGFSEYETQINAVQTILANTESKGSTLEDVNKSLDELNTYADKTIYNFTEMTRNIGTFTAAGVDLDTSVKSIQGIANLAAVSGSTSQQASTAMYQLSQALAAGKVSLMDWNSVVNAGMGGQVFQDALKRTARAMGKDVDGMIKKYGSFRESLTQGEWLTTDVLTKTLEQFTMAAEEGSAEWEAFKKSLMDDGYTADQAEEILKMANTATNAATKVKTFTQLWDTLKESAQSGWTQTWEIIVGDFEEAKELLTSVSDTIGAIIGKSAEARNSLLQGWKDSGGRKDLIESFKNIFDAIVSIVTPIKEAFRELFPPTTVDQLVKFTEGLKNFTARLKLSDAASENLKKTFKGLFGVVKIITQAFSAVFRTITSLIGGVAKFGGGILGVTGAFGEWISGVSKTIEKTGIFHEVLTSIVNVVKKVASGITSAINSIVKGLENGGILNFFTAMWNGVKAIASGITNLLKRITSGFGDTNFDGIFGFIEKYLSPGVIGVMLFKLIGVFKDLFSTIGDFKESFIGVIDGVTGVFSAMQTRLKAGSLQKIATAIAILAGAIFIISLVDSEKLGSALGAIGALFAELLIAMKVFTMIGGLNRGVRKSTSAMIGMSLAVLILASALKKIADLEFKQLMTGLIGVAGLMGIVVGAMKVLNKNGKTIVKGAMQMILFATAVKILASVCKDLAALSWEELAKGLTGVGVLMAEVAIFLRTAKFSGKSITTATGIVLLASAIKILASACYDFAQMSWKELTKGLSSIGILLAEITVFTRLTGNAKKVISTGLALIAISAAMKIFASAIQDMSSMSWSELGRGLVGMAGALAAVVIAVRLLPKNMISSGLGLIGISTALVILASSLGKMGGMSWSEIARGLSALGGAMAILAIGLNVMKKTLAGSAALLVASTALAVLTPVLKALGSMNWSTIGKSLLTLAGAFTVIGLAGLLLKPVVGTFLALAAAMVLIGAGTLALGVGLLAAGAGLSALAVGFTALASSLTVGVLSLIPAIIKQVGYGIIALCEVIVEGAPAIGKAFKAVLLSLIDVLVECVPAIAKGALELVIGVLQALVDHTPTLVNLLFDFLVGLLDGIAERVPDLIQSVVNIIMSVFVGAAEALSNIDSEVFVKGAVGIGIMAGIMAALAAVSSLIPGAMISAIGMGLVIAELAAVLAAIGALAQIPGLTWLVNEGGKLMESIGNAIGKLIGGIIGGIMEGITSSLPSIGTDLSEFMVNVQPFIDGAKSIDASAMSGVMALIDCITALTAANVFESIGSWLTGGNDIVDFGNKIAEFGPSLAAYASSVSGIDVAAVQASAEAAKALAEMTSAIPNEGGVIGWFAGENSIASFGDQLPKLGAGLMGFALNTSGINPASVVAAAEAAKVLADMTSTIPNSGGVVSWFAGDNSIAKFGQELFDLGEGLAGFALNTNGINPQNVTAAANAAKALAEMTATIPNSGGVASWFSGDNSIAKFSDELADLGRGLYDFSLSIAGMNPSSVIMASQAAKALAEMTAIIPNEGGMVAWFTGENSLASFSSELPKLGEGLFNFSTSIAGMNPAAVMSAAQAAKTLAEMTSYIPNEGGMVAWFTGENSLANFSAELSNLGVGLLGFALHTNGINTESVTAAAQAAKTLAEMTSYIPNEGGVASWFTGESAISKFSAELINLGIGLLGFALQTNGINAESVVAAANAGKALAEMTNIIPNEGGMKAWFSGESGVAKFAENLPTLGAALYDFSIEVAGIVPENVTAAANAAKTLAEMTDTLPKNLDKITEFGTNLETFGGSMSAYFDATDGITAEAVSSAMVAISAVESVTKLDSSKIESMATAIDKLITSLKGLGDVDSTLATEFTAAIKKLGEVSADTLVEAFNEIDAKMRTEGKDAINEYIGGVESKEKTAKTAFITLVEACANAIGKKGTEFKKAGAHLVTGFCAGITQNIYMAKAKARAMAAAAAEAARKELDEHSPSKVGYEIGDFFGIAFVNAIDDNVSKAYRASTDLAASAKTGLSGALSRINDLINNDMDTNPTIRPILDLSDVKSGADTINGMLGVGSSINVLSRVGSLSTMMSRYGQNGTNSDVVSAIDKLRKDLGNVGNTSYNINGISANGDAEVEDAIRVLVRAATVERRT